MERLQKVIAQSGVTSRRKAEELIQEGHVKVNGIVVTEMGFKVSKDDAVTVKDKPIAKMEKKYFVLNKPSGVLSTLYDDKNRKTITDFIEEKHEKYRLFPVGRLDYDTTGLIILTNDGTFSNMITSPNSHVQKEYIARIKGIIRKATSIKLEKGVKIDDFVTQPAKVELIEYDTKNNSSLVKIIITEGKYHQVKKMFESVGHPVKKLRRSRIGSLVSPELPMGSYRELSIHEVKSLIGEAKQRKQIKHERKPKQIRRY